MPYPRSLADIKKSLTNSGVLGNLYPQMQDVGQDDVDPNRYTLPVEAAPITDRFPGAPRGLYPGMGAGITDEPAPPGTVPTNEPSFSVPAPTGAMNAPASTGDRYQRDEGIPIRPDGVKDSDFVLHGDGTPSKWTWAVMDDMRGFLQTERAKDATRKQNEADRATSRHQTAERLANSGADGAGTSNIPAPTMRPSQTTQGKINDVLDKDYSITKNKDGTVTKGKDRDEDFDYKDVLGGAGLGALQGFQRGGLIGGIIGAITGATDRNTAEKYHDSQTLSRLYPKYQAQAGMEAQDQKFDLGQTQIGTERAQGRNYDNEIANRNVKTLLDIDKATQDRLTGEQSNILKVWQDLDTYDASKPEYKALADRAAKAGVELVKKDKGQRYSATITPNGRLKILNTSTGAVTDEGGDYSKPTHLTSKDISDLFPDLPDDAKLGTMATASVGEVPPGTRIKPAMLAALKQDKSVLDEFGEINMPKVLAAYDPNEVFENLPSDYKQRHAQAVLAAGKLYEAKRAEITKLGAAVESQKSLQPGGHTKSRNELKQMWDTAYSIKDSKKRRQALDDLYRTIEAGYLQVQ